jgi:transposase
MSSWAVFASQDTRIEDGVMRLSPAQLSALFEGLDWAKVRAVRKPPPQAVQ